MNTKTYTVRGMATCDLPQVVAMACRLSAYRKLPIDHVERYFQIVLDSPKFRSLVAEDRGAVHGWMVYRPDVSRYTILAVSGHGFPATFELVECLIGTLGGTRRYADLLIVDKPKNEPMVSWASARGLVRRYDDRRLIATFSVPRGT